MTARPCAAVGLALALLPVAACAELTEVVLVVESDLVARSEVDAFTATVAPGPVAPTPGGARFISIIDGFPLSVGFVSQGETKSFSFVAQLLTTASAQPEIRVSRTVSDVRFAEGEVRMFVLTMPRVCACEGTACPLPGNPACDKLTNPTLEPFDPDRAPPSTMMSFPSVAF